MPDASTAAVVMAALFGVVGAAVARRVRPWLGVWMVTVGGCVAAACGAVVLALLALPLVAQSPEIAEAGHWSVRALDRHDPTNDGIATTALLLLAVVVGRAVSVIIRRMAATRSARRACRDLGPDAGGVIVVEGDRAEAYAVAGRPGRVVVTRRILAALSLEQRRALLAHERAHLTHHHHVHITATAVAIALNPLLRPLAAAQAFCVERAADEAAATATDRSIVALTLQNVADVTGAPGGVPAAVLSVADAAVTQRREALSRPALGTRPGLTLASATVLAAVVLTTGHAWTETMAIFKLSHTTHRTFASAHRPLPPHGLPLR